MSTATVRYRFEYRLFDWAESYSRTFCASRVAFLVALRSDGSMRRVYFAQPGTPFDGEQKTSMAQSNPRWFLFAPADEPGRSRLRLR